MRASAKGTADRDLGIQTGSGAIVPPSGKSLSQVARELGIADSTLYHWCKQFADQGQQAFVGSGHQTPQEEELRRLKRELQVTRKARDILKEAFAIFSRNQP